MDIAGSRRGVQDEIVKFAPVGIGDELFQRTRSHASAPQCCRIGINKETYAQEFHAVSLDRFYKVATVFLDGIGTGIFNVEHLRHRRTENICVQESYLVTQTGKRYSEVCRDGALAYSTLAGTYGYDVLHLRQ